MQYQTARRIKKIGEENSEPLYAQILLRKNVQRNSRALVQKESQSVKLNKTESKESKVASKRQTEPSNKAAKDPAILEHSTNSPRYYVFSPRINESYKFSDKTTVNKPKNVSSAPLKLGGPSNVIPLRMASSTAKIASRTPTVQLRPKKNMNLKSYSDFLCIEPKIPLKMKNEKCDDDWNSVKIDIFKPDKKNPKKKKSSMSLLMKSGLKSKSLKLENNFEKRNTLMKIIENNKRKMQKRKRNEIVLMSLFKKIKSGLY